MQFIFIISQHFFWLSWFLFRLNSNFSSAWHDNQFFFCSFCSFFSFFLSTQSNDAYHKRPSKLKHLFSCEDLFRKGLAFGLRLLVSLLSRERWGSKVFSKNGQFLVNVPWGINQGDFKVSRSLGFCFAYWKGFDRLETVASLDAYQITNYQFLSKLIIFLLPDFRKIWEIGF